MTRATQRPRVGILTQWYAPEPVLIPKTLADALVRAGHVVRVLTGYPNYPGGVLYPGFDVGPPHDQRMDGADVLRVPAFLSHDQSAVRRIRSFLSFAWSSVRRARFLTSCDVIYVYGTPMTAASAALLLRLVRRIPFVIHIQDLWPESVIESGMLSSGRIGRIVNGVISLGLRPLYRMADHLIVISPGMKEALVDRGIRAGKITVLLNWDTAEPDVLYEPLQILKDNERIRCLYAGNIGLMQDVKTIIRAAAEIQDDLPLDISIYGSGVEEESARQLALDLRVRNVSFMGRVSRHEMLSAYQVSHYQLVTLKDRNVFRMTIPSKFQASMANGIPVITTVLGDLADICIQNEVGLVAQPESAASLADAFRRAAALGTKGRSLMSQRSHAFYRRALTVDQGTAVVMNILNSAAKSRMEQTDEAK